MRTLGLAFHNCFRIIIDLYTPSSETQSKLVYKTSLKNWKNNPGQLVTKECSRRGNIFRIRWTINSISDGGGTVESGGNFCGRSSSLGACLRYLHENAGKEQELFSDQCIPVIARLSTFTILVYDSISHSSRHFSRISRRLKTVRPAPGTGKDRLSSDVVYLRIHGYLLVRPTQLLRSECAHLGHRHSGSHAQDSPAKSLKSKHN